MNFMSSLPTVVTEHENGRFAAGVNRSPSGCGMVRLSRRRSPLRLAKSHSGNFWSFWNSDSKGMTEHDGKRPPDQAGQGLNRVYSITPDGVGALSRQTAEQKSPTFGLNILAIQPT